MREGRWGARVLLVLGLVAAGCGSSGGGGTDAAADVVAALDFAGTDAVPVEPSPEVAAPDDAAVEAPDVAPEVPETAVDAPAPDAAPDTGEVQQAPCTREGFQVVSAVAETCTAAEGGFLNLVAADSFTAPADTFGLELLLDERTLGPYAFVDENYATCERCVRLEAECTNEDGCRKTFLVYAGTMDVTLWEDPGGRFRATFTGLRAREVTISSSLPLTSTPVENGETWCVDTLSLDVGPLGTF